MKIIDVLNMIANGEIKEGTKIILNDDLFIFNGGVFVNDLCYLETCMFLKKEDLNQEVELIPPKPNKYYLRLNADDDLSYVTRSSYDNDFNYDLGDENEIMEFKTKFTQEEIDNDKLLKFIEQHGIKEVVDEDEND